MKTSIATVSIAGDFKEKLVAISEANFDGIEIFENDFLAFDESPRKVGEMVRDHGLEIYLFQPLRDFEGLREPFRSRAFERAERKFDIMQELGTDLILVCSNVSSAAIGGVDRAAEDLFELGEIAAKRNLRIGYEALAWGKYVSDHRDAWEIVRRADHKNVGLIVDSFHTLGRKIDPQSIRSIPGDKIFFVQLADAPDIDMDLLYWSRHFRNMPGQGDLDITSFMRAVLAAGYSGPLSLEIFNDQFRGGASKTIALDGYRSLINLMDEVNIIEPNLNINSPKIPQKTDVNGVEFIEFTSNKTEALELGNLLSTMGFKKSGRHIYKDIDLWRQGEINILINIERKGFAQSSYLYHGTNICDMGLMVGDAQATIDRAKSLGATIFKQPIRAGELKIPAIRSVGGGIIHFIDKISNLEQVWQIEFEQFDDNPAPLGVGLATIDHISETMNYEEMLTWQLFYTSIFNIKKTAMIDIVDPAGLIRSQAIENENGSFRLTLNGADNRRTMAGDFLLQSMGSTVQHLAFSTNDIFATSKRLSENGFKSLKISDNYYSDLDTRFEFEKGFVETLKQNNILYDRDENGDFFQLYSQTYGDGFFFEIVERRGRYNGYGAANAMYRIAAQKRGMAPKELPKIK